MTKKLQYLLATELSYSPLKLTSACYAHKELTCPRDIMIFNNWKWLAKVL